MYWLSCEKKGVVTVSINPNPLLLSSFNYSFMRLFLLIYDWLNDARDIFGFSWTNSPLVSSKDPVSSNKLVRNFGVYSSRLFTLEITGVFSKSRFLIILFKPSERSFCFSLLIYFGVWNEYSSKYSFFSSFLNINLITSYFSSFLFPP